MAFPEEEGEREACQHAVLSPVPLLKLRLTLRSHELFQQYSLHLGFPPHCCRLLVDASG